MDKKWKYLKATMHKIKVNTRLSLIECSKIETREEGRKDTSNGQKVIIQYLFLIFVCPFQINLRSYWNEPFDETKLQGTVGSLIKMLQPAVSDKRLVTRLYWLSTNQKKTPYDNIKMHSLHTPWMLPSSSCIVIISPRYLTISALWLASRNTWSHSEL